MLTELSIRDFAIVSRTDLNFAAGMTVVTGETGAGKSIIIGALGLCLGDRADSGVIRHGAERADLTARFDLGHTPAARRWLKDNDLDEDGDCLLRRVIRADGSKAYINGRPAPLTQVRELAELLMDIHSQHQHQSLLRRDFQRQLLDAYAGLQEEVSALAHVYGQWQRTEQELGELESQSRDRAARLDFLDFQIEELEKLAPAAGEWAELGERHQRLAHAEAIQSSLSSAIHSLDEDEYGAVLSRINQVEQQLQEAATRVGGLSNALELVESARIQLAEATEEIRHQLQSTELDPAQLDEVEQRMGELSSAARKHRMEPEALSELLEEMHKEREGLGDSDSRGEAPRQQLAQLEGDYRQAAAIVSKKRQQGGKRLAREVSKLMAQLGMAGGRFEVELEALEEGTLAAGGLERVQFLVSANAGQPPRPLNKVASGGELSRISLAIQVITSQVAKIPSLVFDEVDVGIGGGVAEIVGQMLAELGRQRQVICITHQAQVAAQGRHHLRVEKQQGKQVSTTVRPLHESERVEELARMIGGVEMTSATLEHAGEMLARAQQVVA